MKEVTWIFPLTSQRIESYDTLFNENCPYYIATMASSQDETLVVNAGKNSNNEQQEEGVADAAPGEATLLVSEFPPPPYYFKRAANGNLQPPEIPVEALARGTRRAAAAAARARAEAEKMRLAEHSNNTTDAILGGVLPDQAAGEDEEGDVVAVFGEIVEDPSLVVVQDSCDDPVLVRDEVKRLNRHVLEGFVKLVQDLVHQPMENKCVLDMRALHLSVGRMVSYISLSLSLLYCCHFCPLQYDYDNATMTARQKDSRRVDAQHFSHAARMQQISRASSTGTAD